jgi:hypothetical protein
MGNEKKKFKGNNSTEGKQWKDLKKGILIHGKKTWQVRGSIQLVGNQLRICFAAWRFSDE